MNQNVYFNNHLSSVISLTKSTLGLVALENSSTHRSHSQSPSKEEERKLSNDSKSKEHLKERSPNYSKNRRGGYAKTRVSGYSMNESSSGENLLANRRSTLGTVVGGSKRMLGRSNQLLGSFDRKRSTEGDVKTQKYEETPTYSYDVRWPNPTPFTRETNRLDNGNAPQFTQTVSTKRLHTNSR